VVATLARFILLAGVHSESTTCGNLLASKSPRLSEPVVFDLGSGIGFEYMERCDRSAGFR